MIRVRAACLKNSRCAVQAGRLTACLLALCLLGGLCLPVRAAAAGRLPYCFRFENLNGDSSGQRDTLLIGKNRSLAAGETLQFSGWLAVEGGVRGYEYAFVPTGDDAAVGSPEWLTPPVSGKAARNDLKAAGVPYSSGHATAGFSLELTAPTGREGFTRASNKYSTG